MKPRKLGLRISYHEHVERLAPGAARVLASAPAGWFIEVHRGSRWYALIDLRFVREKDALRAAQSLTAAGLDSHGTITRADPLTVKETACRFLQW